jgi:hypothetical protein
MPIIGYYPVFLGLIYAYVLFNIYSLRYGQPIKKRIVMGQDRFLAIFYQFLIFLEKISKRK